MERDLGNHRALVSDGHTHISRQAACVCACSGALTSDRGSPCRWLSAPVQASLPPSRSGPPWTSSLASVWRDGSAWANPRAYGEGLLSRSKVRGQRWTAGRLAAGRRCSPTGLVAWRQVLVLVARVSLLAVQQQEVDHLLLVVAADRKRLGLVPPRLLCSSSSSSSSPSSSSSSSSLTLRRADRRSASPCLGSSPESSCSPERRGRSPRPRPASGPPPSWGGAAPAPARSFQLCGGVRRGLRVIRDGSS